MKRLGVFESVLESELAVSSEHELPDVLAVGRLVIVSQQGETLVARGQFGPEARAAIAGRTFRPVGAVGGDLLVYGPADVHYPIDQDVGRAAPVVVLLPHRLQLKPGGQLFGVIVFPAGHPAGGLDTMGRHVMVGVLLITAPGIVTNDRVYLQESK